MREGVRSYWARRVGSCDRASIEQRNVHIVRAIVGGAGCIVDRGLIRRPVGGKATHTFRSGIDNRRGKVSIEPLERSVTYSAAAVGDWGAVFVNLERIGRSPIRCSDSKVLRNDISIAGKLESTNQFIQKAIGVAKESLSASNGQIDDSIELDVLLRDGGVDMVVLKDVQCMPVIVGRYARRTGGGIVGGITVP